MARILLTGASGYVGSAVAAELDRRGLDWDPLPVRLEMLAPGSLYEYRKVIHAAGAPRYRGEREINEANRLGTRRLVAALGEGSSVLFLSSRSVYGHRPGMHCDESFPARPDDAYGAAKRAAEIALLERRGQDVILRLGTLIGRGPGGIGHSFFAQSLRGMSAGETVLRYMPDRLHDAIDLFPLARVCADWAEDVLQLPAGISNMAGTPRSLHQTLATIASAVAMHWGLAPRIVDTLGPVSPWPLLASDRLRAAIDAAAIAERSDAMIAAECCAWIADEKKSIRKEYE